MLMGGAAPVLAQTTTQAEEETAPAEAMSEAEAEDSEVITVTAIRLPIEVETAPATVTVIDAEEMADELVTDIKELVRFEPGVSVTRQPARFSAAFSSTGRGGNEGFNIRGIGGNRVLIQVDGIRIPDGFSFGPQVAGRGDYVDLGLVKSVEILRGPASALYGSDGLSGVVSFITSDPVDFLEGGSDIGALARLHFSSADEEFAETAIVVGRSGEISAMAAYTRRDFQELDNQGEVGGTGSTRTEPNPQDGSSDAFLGKLVWEPAAGHAIRLTGEYIDTFLFTDVLTGLGPSGFGPAIVDDLTARDSGERARATLGWTWNGSGDGILDFAHVAAYWQNAEDVQFADEDRSFADDRERLNTFENRVYGATAELRSNFATGAVLHRLVYGGDISFTRQEGLREGVIPPFGETFPTRAFPVTDFTLAGLYLGDELSFAESRVKLYPALRFDYYDLTPEDDPLLPTFQGAEQDGSRLSPKFGAVVAIVDNVLVYGDYAQGFKAPSPSQVNNFFENLAFGYTSLPNPDLGPETSESWEAGLRYVRDALFAGITYFQADYDDFISQLVVSGSFTPQDPAVFQFVNIDRAEVEGIEGKFRLRTRTGFTVDLAAAWATGDQIAPDGSRAPLATIDPFNLVGGIGYRDPGRRYGGQLFLTYNARKGLDDTEGVCSGFAGPVECFRPDSSLILDATAFLRLAEQVTLRAGVFNITDEKYALWNDVRGLAATSSVTDAYTRPGRNYSASVSFRF
ncbi:MAG: TonB-dependent hemoglobin/transferrin/lactoferrin family receptor [Sphingomonadaceae bacterium]